jgi:DNA-binding response OmpR family regulator
MTSQRVLLADSDERLLRSYADRLTQAGFEVKTATDGLECLDALKDFDPDLLVLEPQIPWGQGDGVVSLMREEPDVPLVPLIVLTSGTNLLEEYQLPRFPVLERHQKPLSAEELAKSVSRLARKTAEREAR